MKVKVLDVKLQHIHYEGKIYKTGEVLNIKDEDFDSAKFAMVGKPPKKEEPPLIVEDEPKNVEKIEPIIPSDVEEPPTEKTKPTKRRRKRQF